MTLAVKAPVVIADRTTEYARAVIAGTASNSVMKTPVGKWVKLAAQRHLRDLKEGYKRGLTWRPDLAERAIDFFGFVNHFEGPLANCVIPHPHVGECLGQPVILEPWECFIIGSVWGWLRADGTRRFRRAFTEVAKKNGKTLIAGGVALLLAFFDGESGAQVYSAATKRDQAKLVWNAAKTMVEKSPALRARLQTRALSIFDPHSTSSFRPLGRDYGGEDGINPNGVIVDELHRHEDAGLVGLLSESFGARNNPLLWEITTAGMVGESVWAEEHDYAEKVLEGIIEDDALFAVIYSLDKDDDPFDEATWPKANPNLGVSIRMDDMRERAQEAQAKPSKLNDFKRLRLDIRTQSLTRWLTHEMWSGGDEPPGPLAGRLAYGGLDLGARSDLAAFLAVLPNDDGTLDVVPHFWLPEDAIAERVKKDRVPYDAWVKQGFIKTTPGNVTDYDTIRADLNRFIGVTENEEEIADFADLYEIGYDPHDATQLATQLQADGFRLVRIIQSTTEMDSPIKEVERFIFSKRLRHGGHPVLAWMVDNTVMAHDASGRRRPDKEKAREKIDGVSALLNAIKRWMANAGSEDVWTAA